MVMRVWNGIRRQRRIGWFVASAIAVLAISAGQPALAYVGPGAGLTAIGTVLALLAAIGLMLVGFVWYPIKRLRRRRRAANGPATETATDNGPEAER